MRWGHRKNKEASGDSRKSTIIKTITTGKTGLALNAAASIVSGHFGTQGYFKASYEKEKLGAMTAQSVLQAIGGIAISAIAASNVYDIAIENKNKKKVEK